MKYMFAIQSDIPLFVILYRDKVMQQCKCILKPANYMVQELHTFNGVGTMK